MQICIYLPAYAGFNSAFTKSIFYDSATSAITKQTNKKKKKVPPPWKLPSNGKCPFGISCQIPTCLIRFGCMLICVGFMLPSHAFIGRYRLLLTMHLSSHILSACAWHSIFYKLDLYFLIRCLVVCFFFSFFSKSHLGC